MSSLFLLCLLFVSVALVAAAAGYLVGSFRTAPGLIMRDHAISLAILLIPEKPAPVDQWQSAQTSREVKQFYSLVRKIPGLYAPVTSIVIEAGR